MPSAPGLRLYTPCVPRSYAEDILGFCRQHINALPLAVPVPHDPSRTTSCRLKELQQAMWCAAGGYVLDDEGEHLTHAKAIDREATTPEAAC